jgi:hypothetical protein
MRGALFQRSVDRRELGVQLAADAVHDGYDDKRDSSGKQSIFDRRSAGLVRAEFSTNAIMSGRCFPIREATVNIDRDKQPQSGVSILTICESAAAKTRPMGTNIGRALALRSTALCSGAPQPGC